MHDRRRPRRAGVSPKCRGGDALTPGVRRRPQLETQLFTIVGYGVEVFANANIPLGSTGGTRKFGTFRAIPGQDVTGDSFLKLSGRHFDTGTCFGDSGGPVFANGLIVGVVSFGQSIVCASPGYNTRVDVASVSSWIAETIAEINTG